MAIVKIHGASILAPDLSASSKFYNLLGFKTVESGQDKLRHITTLTLESPDGFILEIFQPTGKDILFTGGLKHMTFLSDDINADLSNLKKNNAPIIGKKPTLSDEQEFFFTRSKSGEFIRITKACLQSN